MLSSKGKKRVFSDALVPILIIIIWDGLFLFDVGLTLVKTIRVLLIQV